MPKPHPHTRTRPRPLTPEVWVIARIFNDAGRISVQFLDNYGRRTNQISLARSYRHRQSAHAYASTLKDRTFHPLNLNTLFSAIEDGHRVKSAG